MKTNELRALIKTKLSTVSGVKGVFYQEAQDKKMYPHIVFDLKKVGALADGFKRDDYSLYVDIYSKDMAAVLDYSDTIEALLDSSNIPQTNILPTFFFEGSNEVPDEDPSIKHISLEFTIQNYAR